MSCPSLCPSVLSLFLFNVAAPCEIYTLSYTTLFRSLAGLGVLVAPGMFYGEDGGAFVRVALTATDERIAAAAQRRSEEQMSELQSRGHLVCRLLLEKKKKRGSGTPTRRDRPCLPARS